MRPSTCTCTVLLSDFSGESTVLERRGAMKTENTHSIDDNVAQIP